MIAPGSAITDVAGVKVGHFSDPRRPTGCTVILTESGAVAGVDVRGAAPGTRETDLLAPTNLIEKVHAVLLSGGSAFGLDAAGGVMRWLEEHGFGIQVGPVRVPIVPAAVLFDLYLGDPSIRPDAAAGYQACVEASSAAPAEGSVGAGSGACVGKLFGFERAMKGGVGSAAVCIGGVTSAGTSGGVTADGVSAGAMTVGGVTVGALIAVNPLGDVIDPCSGLPLAGARDDDGSGLLGITRSILAGRPPRQPAAGDSTTIGVIATDAILTKPQAQKLAQMAHDGLARVIDPVHTMADGDTLFALGTGASGRPADMTVLGPAVAAVTAEAVLRAVRAARGVSLLGWPAIPGLADRP